MVLHVNQNSPNSNLPTPCVAQVSTMKDKTKTDFQSADPSINNSQSDDPRLDTTLELTLLPGMASGSETNVKVFCMHYQQASETIAMATEHDY